MGVKPFFVVGLAALLGCTSGGSDVEKVRLYEDDLGRSVQIPVRPQRVVTLAPSLTEIVFAAGGGDRLAAITTADDHPPAVKQLPRIGAYPLNREAVVAQAPDLILATDQVNSLQDIKPISELGIPTVFLRFETIDGIISAVREVGKLLGLESRADSSAAALAARWADLQAGSSAKRERPTLLILIGADVLYSFGGDSYVNEMIAAAGAESVTTDLPAQSAVLTDEFVLARSPQMILGPAGSGSDSDFSLETLLDHHPAWDALPAIRNGHVFTLDPDLIFRPGPRAIDGAERIAQFVDAVVAGNS